MNTIFSDEKLQLDYIKYTHHTYVHLKKCTLQSPDNSRAPFAQALTAINNLLVYIFYYKIVLTVHGKKLN